MLANAQESDTIDANVAKVTSVLPIRSALEMSKTVTDVSSTPPVPRAWRAIPFIALFQAPGFWPAPDSIALPPFVRWRYKCSQSTWQPARRPVPQLDGQVRIQPRASLFMNFNPNPSMVLHASMKRLATAPMSLPSLLHVPFLPCMETTRM